MNRGVTEITFGLEIIEGLMGSGKSYHAVRRLLQVIIEDRRPVYTNLPLRWRVVRKYLHNRGGEELAGLIHKLDEKHWRSFLARQTKYAKFIERMRIFEPCDFNENQLEQLAEATGYTVEKIKNQPRMYDWQYLAWFRLVEGDEVYKGPKADSIPQTALIVIDEVQHWHGMHNQLHDESRDDLQAYLTMCRHHLHWIWVITQDRTRIAKVFRLLAQSVWRVWDRGEDRLAWGVRVKHVNAITKAVSALIQVAIGLKLNLSFRAMGYERYTPEQLEGTNWDNKAPSECYTILPMLPKNRVFFRLYNSFTNIADPKQLMRELRRARKDAGLAEDGTTENENQESEVEEMKKPSILKRLFRFVRFVIIIVVIGTFSYAIGTGTQKGASTNDESAQETTVEEPLFWPKWNAAGTQPYFDGVPASDGDRVGNRGVLAYYAPDRSSVVLLADNHYWVWLFGEPQPRRVGTFEDVRDAVAATRPGAGASVEGVSE